MSELDRLLSIVVDVENLFMCVHTRVHTEKDPDAKQVYIYLFKVCKYIFLISQSYPAVHISFCFPVFTS